MDKYEYNLKLDQMKSLYAEERYQEAAELADTVNWNKVKNPTVLLRVGEIYEKVERYDDSREVLLMAYDRSPIGRGIIYRLAEVAVKMQDFQAAEDYYEEFVELAPHDTLRYVLRYNMKKARGESCQELIPILEELKEQEYTEEWAYELAYLYHKAGMSEKCIDACDELILWFGDGPYVERALELKMLYQPLTKVQEEKYRSFRQAKDGLTHIGTDEMQHAGEFAHEAVAIPQVEVNSERYNTVNLQEEIARGMQQILDATEQSAVEDTLDNINKMVEDIPYLKIPKEEGSDFQELLHIETDEEIDDSLKINFQELLGEDSDGQISLVMDEAPKLERQITGQITIEEVLNEWERTKRAAETALQDAQQRKLESAKARALQQAENLMDRLTDVIPKLDAGVTPRELLEEEYLQERPLFTVANDVVEEDSGQGLSEEQYISEEDWTEEDFGIEVISEEELMGARVPEEPGLELGLEGVPEAELGMEPELGLEGVPEAELGMEPELGLEEVPEADPGEAAEAVSGEAKVSAKETMTPDFDLDRISEGLLTAEALQSKAGPGATKSGESPKKSAFERGKTEKWKTKSMRIPEIMEPKDLGQEEGSDEPEAIEKLTDEQKKIFSYFIPVKGMERQLCRALTGVSHRLAKGTAASSGNLIIQGGQGCGKTNLATSMIRVLQMETGHPNDQIGKISGEAFNRKDVRQLLQKVSGGCLIIERAGELERQTVVTLSLLLEQDTSGLLVILEDTSLGIKKVLSLDEHFAKKFTETITVPIFTNDDLVTFAKAYSKELGYEIDEMAVLALYTRISSIQRLDQATTLTEVKEIVDEAIQREARGGIKKFFSILTASRYTDDDCIVLKEKDFE